MSGDLFDEAKRQMMAAGTPSDGLNLDGMSIDFDAYLSRANLFEHVAVHQTGDTNCMLIASCRVAPGGTPTAVGEALVSIWQDKLRYHHRAAHRLRQDHLGLHLDVVTLSDDGGILVTGQITATWQGRPSAQMSKQKLVGGALNAVQNDRVTEEEVRAQELQVGDQVRLSTQFGARAVRLTSIEQRANGFKFTGIDDDGARNSSGFRHEELVLRIQSAPSREEGA